MPTVEKNLQKVSNRRGRNRHLGGRHGHTGPIENSRINQSRWYDPSVGRWLSEDPIGFAAGDANLNRYCGNEPTKATDPTGLADELFSQQLHASNTSNGEQLVYTPEGGTRAYNHEPPPPPLPTVTVPTPFVIPREDDDEAGEEHADSNGNEDGCEMTEATKPSYDWPEFDYDLLGIGGTLASNHWHRTVSANGTDTTQEGWGVAELNPDGTVTERMPPEWRKNYPPDIVDQIEEGESHIEGPGWPDVDRNGELDVP